MMKKLLISSILSILFLSSLYSQIEHAQSQIKGQIVSRKGFTVSYNETHEQANWVAYELTASELNGSAKRTNNFSKDPRIKTGSALSSDYTNSGYDRGHLAPAADMTWSQSVMRESFYMTNISPQQPGFNRGIWKKLESYVRQWAYDNQSIYIVTGGILSQTSGKIGSSGVSIPNYFYKVILDYTKPEIKGIAFILPNQSSKRSIQSYAVTIDKVEEMTGIDFFYKLPDNIEQKVESEFNLYQWNFKSYKPPPSSEKTINLPFVDPIGTLDSFLTPKTSITTQCLGITQKGERCKRKTKDPSGYCYQHD
tara:strand:- start:88 stop:1014 length:927 start_codon:yes stop_codon:yes gene_type:complete